LRAIGSTLANYGYKTADPDRQKALIVEAASYLERAVECMQGDFLEKAGTLYLLAPKYKMIDQNFTAIKYYDQAYNMLQTSDAQELSAEKHDKIESLRIVILSDKARVYSTMEQSEDALRTFNEARRLSGKQPLTGSTLDDITLLYKKGEPADAYKLMEVLRSWTDKERNSWFSYCFESWVDEDAVTRMQRAAKLAKDTDILLDWLEALANTLPTESFFLFNLRCAIAYIYYPVLGDLERGETLRREIMAMKTKSHPYFENTMNETRTQQRMELADILFCMFQMSSDPIKKEEIMEKLRLLPSAHDSDDNIRESHIGMLRANMLRIMGPAKEYQKYMDELFTSCVRGLEDSVSWNDSPSLRLLSKVLASLDTLEKDARIAISAQFSILDRAIHSQDVVSEASETIVVGDGGEDDTEHESTEEIEPSTGSVETRDDPQADGVSEVADDASGRYQDPAASATVPDSAQTELSKLDEDLTEWSVGCDGQCGMRTLSWTQPLYYCVVCPNTDLCEDCHSKRIKETAGGDDKPWVSFCGANHRYIKGPMKDWKGIQNGVIRIGDEKCTVKEWLRGLKQQRWPDAWKIFWTRQGGLKDIGVED
jgi:tetratricopeptide (TPR) repeat protein